MKTAIIGVSLLALLNLNASDIKLDSILKNVPNTSNKIKLLKEDLKLIDINQNQNDSIYSPTLYLKAQAGRKDSYGENINDSYAYLVFKKNLYNQKTNIINSNFKFEENIKKDILKNELQKEKINYMKSYFDVLISDLFFQYQSERIVPIYSKKSKADDKKALLRTSDIEVYKTTSDLLIAQDAMLSAKENKSITRSILANMINVDEYNLTSISKPNIKFYWDKKKLDIEVLKPKMYKNNLNLKILNQQLKEINTKITNLSHNNNINISANAKVGSEPRLNNSNDDIRWQASVNLSIPLYDNNKDTFTIRKLKISQNKLKININILKQKLNKELLNILLNIQKNKRIKKALYSKFDYADLNSEKSRALFEIDRKSDLGNSLTLETQVLYEFRKNEYNYVINNEKLNLLIGEKNEFDK